MTDSFALVTGLHWAAILCYALATILVTHGLIFASPRTERLGYRLTMPGLGLHAIALLLWWRAVGHGPYMDRFEVLSSNAWVLLVFFLTGVRIWPRLRIIGPLLLTAAFSMIGLGLFLRPEIKHLPPTFRSLWLILHITFYKIALAALLVALAFSLLFLLRERGHLQGLAQLPELPILDSHAYRFAGFGFAFWTIGMATGSIWAYQSWNAFWSWDPVQTWSLITWASFGIYLHLRRFFGWRGSKAALFFVVCFGLALAALFVTPFLNSSIHAGYFK